MTRASSRKWERLPMSAYQAPRFAGYSEIRHAWKAGNPISGDFKYKDGFVYVAVEHGSRLIKVGLSNNPKQRMKGLRRDFGCDVELLATFKGDRQEEMILHEKLAEWRVRGGWFSAESPVFWDVVSDHFLSRGVDFIPPAPSHVEASQ